MTKQDNQSGDKDKQVDNLSGGGHLGGTNFGQQGGDAKLKRDQKEDGKPSTLSDGNNSN